jgi:hypothetical protein
MLERAAQKLCLDQLVIQQGSQKVILIVPPLMDTFHYSCWACLAANKDELLEMITAGAKIINTNDEYVSIFFCHCLFADINAV